MTIECRSKKNIVDIARGKIISVREKPQDIVQLAQCSQIS